MERNSIHKTYVKRYSLALPPEYEKVALPIREGSEWKTMTVEQYFGKLEAYELEGTVKTPTIASTTAPNQTVAFSAIESIPKQISQSDIDDMISSAFSKVNLKSEIKSLTQEDIPSLISVAVKQAIKHQRKYFDKKHNPSSSTFQQNSNSNEYAKKAQSIECYNCGKPDHYKSECPELKKQRFKPRTSSNSNEIIHSSKCRCNECFKKGNSNEKDKVLIADSSKFSDDEYTSSDSDSDDDEKSLMCMMAIDDSEENKEEEEEEDKEILTAKEELNKVSNLNSLDPEGLNKLACTLHLKLKRSEKSIKLLQNEKLQS